MPCLDLNVTSVNWQRAINLHIVLASGQIRYITSGDLPCNWNTHSIHPPSILVSFIFYFPFYSHRKKLGFHSLKVQEPGL